MRYMYKIACFLLLCPVINTFAADDGTYQALLNKFGITYILGNNSLEIDASEEKMTQKVPELQAINAINPDLSQAVIRMMPYTMMSTAVLGFSEEIFSDIYDIKSKTDKIHVKIYINTTDDYGNDSKKLCLSFNFSRALYKKINWDHMDFEKITRAYPNFQFSPWCTDKMESESAVMSNTQWIANEGK